MAEAVLIIGKSGTGKSTAIRQLDPKVTFIANAAKKNLPFKGARVLYPEHTKDSPGNLLNSDNALTIQKALQYVHEKRPEIVNFVVDDAQYLMGNEYMRRAKENGFDKFRDMAMNLFNLVTAVGDLRPDLLVVFNFHPDIDTDETGNRQIKAKTIGKMFDQYVTLEGLFSVVLYTFARRGEKGMEYGFLTQNSGQNTGKSPQGMFETEEIPNDLKLVREAIWSYNFATE